MYNNSLKENIDESAVKQFGGFLKDCDVEGMKYKYRWSISVVCLGWKSTT